jgi:hypothetical protein
MVYGVRYTSKKKTASNRWVALGDAEEKGHFWAAKKIILPHA